MAPAKMLDQGHIQIWVNSYSLLAWDLILWDDVHIEPVMPGG